MLKTGMPAWKKPPQVRLSLGSLSLSDEVLADRNESSSSSPHEEERRKKAGGDAGAPREKKN